MNADKLSYEQKFVGLSLLKSTTPNHAALVLAEVLGFSLSCAKDIIFDLNARFRICSFGVIERSGHQFFVYEQITNYNRTLMDQAYLGSIADISRSSLQQRLLAMDYLREVQITNSV